MPLRRQPGHGARGQQGFIIGMSVEKNARVPHVRKRATRHWGRHLKPQRRPQRMIVHVTDCFHPRLGGIEVQVEELARAQCESGQEVQVITATPTVRGQQRREYGYPVHRVVASLPWELPQHPRAGAHLTRLFTDLHPDVVHVHVGAVSPFAWSGIWSAMRRGQPTVVTVHSLWDRGTRSMYRCFDGLSGWSKRPLVVTAVSTAAADLLRLTVPTVTVTVVPNGITPHEWYPATGRERAGDDRDGGVHVVAVGRLAQRKQPMVLLKALDMARARVDDSVALRATVAGAGPAAAAMRRYLRRHAMTDWVRLAGRLDRCGVRALLATADLFVNPTVRESFGIASLEARTAGVPVIARTGNGVADFIRHGQEGLLCHSEEDLVNGLVWLAQDHQTRQRIRAHNRATEPTNCTWPVVVAALHRCYQTAEAMTARG
jgi:phosphatidylinositol alpha 1,6-mannosyltransferase